MHFTLCYLRSNDCLLEVQNKLESIIQEYEKWMLEWSLASACMLYFYKSHWLYILDKILRKMTKE